MTMRGVWSGFRRGLPVHPLLLLAGLLPAPALAQAPPPETQTLELGEWYTVTCPKVFLVGTVAQITVAYRGLAEKTKLCCDLHAQKTDGTSGGFYANDWRPKPDVQGEGRYTFTIPIREAENLATVTLLIFTEPTGAWANHTRLATSPPLPVVDPDPGYTTWTKQVRYNKSWIAFDWRSLQQPLTEGDKLAVTLEYYLDPADHYQKTTLNLEALGPRVPKPDAPKPVSFANTQHLWYGAQKVDLTPGRGQHTFTVTVPKAQTQNSLLLLALFKESRDKRWPWDVRASTTYTRRGGYFDLRTAQPGNLFTYDEPVRLEACLRNVKTPGERKTLRYTVHDATRTEVARGEVPFEVRQNGQVVPVALQLTRRGSFVVRAEVEGWEAREMTFCRIPDVMKLTGGRPTPFGMTVHSAPALGARTAEVFQIARRLGLTHCRSFTEWNLLEPGPGTYAFRDWDPFFATARDLGVAPIICLHNPPAWVMPRGQVVGYRMFDCDLAAFKEMVQTVSTRYRGQAAGWEWLNEISPGGTADPVADYVKFCRVGTETARAVDPKLRCVLAGGLWPRNFRLDVLSAGAGQYIDALPIHYGNGGGIEEAQADLKAFGLNQAEVWDNESAGEMIAWEWPGQDLVSETTKCNWVLNQWTDELSAGARRLFYFGGEGSAIADFDYLLADHSPLPVAATLAVFSAKLWDATPVGLFTSVGQAGVCHLFERGGKAVLVASTGVEAGEVVALAVGAPQVTVTDYQGNETVLPAPGGVVKLPLQTLRCFIEGADLDVLKAYLAPGVQAANARGRRELIGARHTLSILRGAATSLPFRVWNPYPRALAGSVTVDLPAGWSTRPTVRFNVPRGQTQVLQVPLTVPAGVTPGQVARVASVRYDDRRLPVVTKPLVLSVFARESVGNLLANGDFEQAEADGLTPVGWRGTNASLVSSEGLGLGLGRRVLRFEKATEWAHYGQQLKLQGGLTYLYTAWIWNQGMEGGSNLTQTLQDGSRRDLYNKQVMDIGDSMPFWQVLTCRYQAPADLAAASFVPVARGGGRAFYDNVRVTVFEGTDFAAEAWKVRQAPAIDGDLGDWDRKCPIPLIGRNQLQLLNPATQWTPANLNGVAYLAWDQANLYFAAEVRDDTHHPAGEGESVTEGDSLTLALDPTTGGAEAARQAFAFYLSAQQPGGSGKVTLWRSRAHNGGRPAGHVARDSSVYDIAIRPGPGGCVYEARLPLSELGLAPMFAGKFGCSIQLNDNDRAGLAARMNWGSGLTPAWLPEAFGRVTLVE